MFRKRMNRLAILVSALLLAGAALAAATAVLGVRRDLTIHESVDLTIPLGELREIVVGRRPGLATVTAPFRYELEDEGLHVTGDAEVSRPIGEEQFQAVMRVLNETNY